MKSEKHFPTIIGLIFLVICIVAGIFLTSSKTSFNSKASGDCKPVNLQSANITDTAADISFITSSSCLSVLSIDGRTVSDVRAETTDSSASPSKIHYFQVKYLKAQTQYSFSIISDGQTITNDLFNFKTSSTPTDALPTSNLAWGRVLNPDLKTAGNAIVYLSIPGAAPLSAFITSNGNWSISLASSFNDTRTSWFIPPAIPTDEDIVVIGEDGSTTQITNNTSLNNPVPDIVLGQNSLTSPQVTPQTGTVGNITTSTTTKTVDILNPKDGDSLPISRPDFFGVAPQNSQVIIEVHSDIPYTGQTSTDNTGVWHWSPPENLTPGQHTVTVKVQDTSTGLWNTVTRNFTVLATDSSTLSYTASASASVITPTSSPVPTIVAVVTSVPTNIPTKTPTAIPTLRTVTPTIVQTPVTGNTSTTIIFIIGALCLFLFSIKLIQ